MNFGPLINLSPLALALLTATADLLTGLAFLRGFRPSLSPSSPVPIAFALVLGVAAVVSNSHQKLYDLGLSFPNIDILQTIIYGLVGLSISCLWWASRRVWFRGTVIVLVLASFVQPLLWTFAFATWDDWGLCPMSNCCLSLHSSGAARKAAKTAQFQRWAPQ
jgi:hypothetical protein